MPARSTSAPLTYAGDDPAAISHRRASYRSCGNDRSVRESRLRETNVFAAGAFGALADVECDGLSFAQIVVPRLGARRVVKEILLAVRGEDKAETLVGHETFDSTGERRHSRFPSSQLNVS